LIKFWKQNVEGLSERFLKPARALLQEVSESPLRFWFVEIATWKGALAVNYRV
jgi:hypothetical protein